MWGLGPMDPAAGVPEPSCPAAWTPPALPFLWSRGVWAGVASRSFPLQWRQKDFHQFIFLGQGEEKKKRLNGPVLQGCFTGERFQNKNPSTTFLGKSDSRHSPPVI